MYLAGHRRHSEAASILIEYADDTEEAISVLINGYQWEEALRLVSSPNRSPVVGLLDSMFGLLAEISRLNDS